MSHAKALRAAVLACVHGHAALARKKKVLRYYSVYISTIEKGRIADVRVAGKRR